MNENFISNDVKVFEGQFTYWNRLPMELKVKVARNFPFLTLWNFMFLSKECMKISSLTRIAVQAVFLCHEQYKNMWGTNPAVQQYATVVVILIGAARIGREEYVFEFSSLEDRGCTPHRRKKGGQAVMGPESPMESCFAKSTRVFLQITQILKPKNIGLESVNVADLKSTLSKLPSTSLITCEALSVLASDLSFLPLLMPHVAPGCELRFYNIDPFPSEDVNLHSGFFDFEVIKAAPLLIIDAVCEINDEQLIHLRASRLYLKAPRILEKGINELILQWMKRRREIHICIATTKTSNYDMVFEENKGKTSSSSEQLQIPFSIKYVEQADPLRKRHAMVCNGLGDRLLVYLGEDYCELVDPSPASLPQTVSSYQHLEALKRDWSRDYTVLHEIPDTPKLP